MNTLNNHGVYETSFRLPTQCSRGFCYPGMLGTTCCYLFTDVSGQRIGPIFNGLGLPRPLKFGPIGLPKTSINNYQHKLRYNAGQRKRQPWSMFKIRYLICQQKIGFRRPMRTGTDSRCVTFISGDVLIRVNWEV